jgi:hypothetical protein
MNKVDRAVFYQRSLLKRGPKDLRVPALTTLQHKGQQRAKAVCARERSIYLLKIKASTVLLKLESDEI